MTEVERALSNPKQETEHFPPAINVIHIGQMHGSQIQQGTIHSKHLGQFLREPDREPLRELLDMLRAVLPEADLEDIPERVGSGGGAALERERQLVGPMSVAWSGPRLAFIAPYWAQWFQVVSGVSRDAAYVGVPAAVSSPALACLRIVGFGACVLL